MRTCCEGDGRHGLKGAQNQKSDGSGALCPLMRFLYKVF